MITVSQLPPDNRLQRQRNTRIAGRSNASNSCGTTAVRNSNAV
jgi:hypothetical protein